jgi:hypothetical protein
MRSARPFAGRRLGLATLLLGVAAAACRGTPPLRQPADDLAYAFELELGHASPLVRVHLAVTGEPDGTSAFEVEPQWGGVGSVAQLLGALEARGRGGRLLELTATGDSSWEARHEPGEELELSWTLRGELAPNTATPDTAGNEYRPLVRADLFHAIGGTSLAWPAWMADGEPRKIALEWRGFREAGWDATSSHGGHGGGAGRVEARCSIGAFRHAVFLAGRLRREERVLPGGGTLEIAVAPGSNGTPGGECFDFAGFADLAASIVAAEREFFDDPGPPRYLITLLPTPSLGPGSFSMGGTGLTDSFALFLSEGVALAPGSDERLRVARLLAHEHMHAWNGHVIQPAPPEELCYWFSEGFTEFYTGRMLLAAGLITPAERVAILNERLAGYWTSAARNLPNREIQERFWQSQEVQELPYARGELVAIALDHEIRRASGGARSLDDLMRELLVDARAGAHHTLDDLIARFARWTSPAFAAGIRAVVADGADVVLAPDTWSEWLALETRPGARYELGFDLEASAAAGVVSGVVPGSNAWNAGLRDGQRLARFDGQPGLADAPVTAAVLDGTPAASARPLELRWLPRGQPIDLPAFRLVADGVF